uniref:Autophagy-related protein 2 n=1 Tax=Oryza punctata TaxID=4537 RepID=A0A0E0LA93_ORYPU
MPLFTGVWVRTMMKRLCKSLLKKRLGDLILGDLDLDQFDLQLTRGTLHLSDIALNADFINRKLSGSAIMMKEGSIKSLLVRIPLLLNLRDCCEIVVEDLELVLAASVSSEDPSGDTECSVSGSNTDNTQKSVQAKRNESDGNQCSTSASRDVDKGVQRIANAVTCFLTNLNIKLKNSYVVFDPQNILNNKVPEFNQSLVFRIKETEFGINLSTDGLIKLHNFVTFHEAVIEFLKMDDVDAHALLQDDLDRGPADISSGHSTTAVLTGPIGGFSGKLNLSIPWNGLNFKKLDADISLNSLELRLQVSSIQWLMDVWDSLQRRNLVHEQNYAHNTADISRSALCSYVSSSSKSGSGSVLASSELSEDTFSRLRQDKTQESSLTMPYVIPDWIPTLIHEDHGDPDSVCDESIDQFFECFEELRNSQTNLGNSGIWDWTCSVFNAITFVSTLASGSDQIPKEPPIEKTLQASIAEISVVLLFSDEMDAGNSSVPISQFDDLRNSEMFSSCLSSAHFEQSMISPAPAANLNMHHVEAKCQNIHLSLETYPENLSLKGSIAAIKLDEYYGSKNNDSDHPNLGAAFLNNNFCREVQASLPQSVFAYQDYYEETSRRHANNSNDLTKVELLNTFGDCKFHYDVSSTGQDGNPVSSTSLSVCLAPLVCWVHFHTIYKLLNFISKIESDVLRGEDKVHRQIDEINVNLATKTNVSSGGSQKVQIALSPARIIFCFPSESWDLSCPSMLDKFLVIDHTPSLKSGADSSPHQNETPNDVNAITPSTLVHLATGNFDIYLVRPVNDALNARTSSLSRQTFSSLKIFSVTGSNCHETGIRMLWKKYPLKDPEMVSKTWSLPNLHEQKSTQNRNGKWVGVSSSTTSEDLEESSSSIRRELLRSTEFLLHIQLSCVSVHLSKKDCVILNHLLKNILDGLSDGATGSFENDSDNCMPIHDTASQTSVIFECSVLDICTELDETVEVGPLLQTELEGSWNSLKLSISKFSLLSSSNVGGVNNASFLWVNHGEGELWGSITGTDDKSYEENKDVLLVVCKDSASRRGDGEGSNILSFGTAGCSVTHIKNPKFQKNYTSINVRSATAVAPGGRMDWISAICLLFSSTSDGTEQPANSSTMNNSQGGEPFSSLFFLELVDVAVSYEPHFRSSALSAETPDCKYFSCLLAASLFKLHSKSASNSTATDFDIELRDLGVLICGSSSFKNVSCGYGADYLRRMGYAKIVQNTFIEAVLRIDTSFWKLELSDSQFDIGTCHDTTHGVIRLCSQLQQLYAPDMRDALDHLQSRWNSVQQANKQNMATDVSEKSDSSIDNLTDSEECKSDGLLDDIIENAFYTDQDCTSYSLSGSEMDEEFGLSKTIPAANDACISLESLLVTPETNTSDDLIIESYYMPPSSSSTLYIEDQCNCAPRTVECDDGEWYNNFPTIDENHVQRNKPREEQVFQQKVKPAIFILNSDESCSLKGKVLIHDIDVKWRMYEGNDWKLAQKDTISRPCSNGRDRRSYLEFIMSALNIQFNMYPDGDISVSKLSISAKDINICDQSTHAPWKMVLGCYNSKDYPRESCSSAFMLELESVRPEPQAPLEDYRLHLEILPLQLHLDQGQLNFLISFFQNDSCNNPNLACENENIDAQSTMYRSDTIADEALLPFFQKFDVKPLVLHINYIPRHFDPVALSKGNYAELLNILPWKGIDLKLKQVSAMGVYGFNNICEIVAAEWLEDISKNQVHKLLKGLPPIKSLVAVSSGTKKLVSLPIKSYKKDRKLLKGMQRGAVAFIRSVSIEAVGLGVHLAAGAHDMLLKTESALSAIPPPLASREAKRTKDNVRANQPESAQEGLKKAYESLTDGFGRTASALIGNPIKVYNRGAGAGSALATAICGAPGAAVAPLSASFRAAHYTLLGIRNSLDPERKKESMYKYHGPPQL